MWLRRLCASLSSPLPFFPPLQPHHAPMPLLHRANCACLCSNCCYTSNHSSLHPHSLPIIHHMSMVADQGDDSRCPDVPMSRCPDVPIASETEILVRGCFRNGSALACNSRLSCHLHLYTVGTGQEKLELDVWRACCRSDRSLCGERRYICGNLDIDIRSGPSRIDAARQKP